jgi:hypothetical protein
MTQRNVFWQINVYIYVRALSPARASGGSSGGRRGSSVVFSYKVMPKALSIVEAVNAKNEFKKRPRTTITLPCLH